MTLRLTLSSHGSSTLEIGLVIDDDGQVTGWQTSGWRVGRFARSLGAEERAGLERALASARSASAGALVIGEGSAAPRSPSGVTEQLVADGLPDATFASNAAPPAGFEALIRVLRGVREDLADFPSAAIELEVAGTPVRARLRHVGTEPVSLRATGELRVEAVVYDRNYLDLEREVHKVSAEVDAPVEPGWELALVDRLELPAPPRGGYLSVTVGPLRVDSVGDGVLRPTEFSWVSE